MIERDKELLLALIIYIITITVLLMAVYKFSDNWNLNEFNFFIAGAVVFVVVVGWGYILFSLLFAPKKKMEETLTTLTNDIIHELNIPLSTISANVSMLQKSIEDEKSHKRLQRIEDASKRLKKLYDELVYTIHKEMYQILKEPLDVKKVVEERVSIFKEQKRNLFELNLVSCKIEVDKIGFEQMLDNILSNAMKYSEKDTPIYISLSADKLCIKDSGIGMNEVELLHVYERYFQSDTNNEGKGIGLALVKRYCDDEGFQIHISSEKNVGTEVCLTLN